MAINLADIIPLPEYAKASQMPLRTIQERARQGTLRHEGKDVCWLKGGRWWVYRHAKHWPKKRGEARK